MLCSAAAGIPRLLQDVSGLVPRLVSGQRIRLQRKSKPDVEKRNMRPTDFLKTF